MKTSHARYAALALPVVGELLLSLGQWLSYEHHVLLAEGVDVQARVEHKEARGKPGLQALIANLVPADHPTVSINFRLASEHCEASAKGDCLTMINLPSDAAIYEMGSLDQMRRLDGRNREPVIGGALTLILAAGPLRRTKRCVKLSWPRPPRSALGARRARSGPQSDRLPAPDSWRRHLRALSGTDTP